MNFQTILSLLAVPLILFLPGFCVSLIFFQFGKIDVIERITLSFALSLAIVPLVVFYTNLLGLPITAMSVMFQAIYICLVSLTICLVQLWTVKR